MRTCSVIKTCCRSIRMINCYYVCITMQLQLFFLLLQARNSSCNIVPCSKDWRCDYWDTSINATCPYNNSWDCFNNFYNTANPLYYESALEYDEDGRLHCIWTTRRCPRPYCSSFADPLFDVPQSAFGNQYFGCFCQFLGGREIQMLLNNGVQNYTLSYHIGDYDTYGGWENAVQYTIPVIDCISRNDPPFNLTIYKLCFGCVWPNYITSYNLSLFGPDDGTYQNRIVDNIDYIKRPQRVHVFDSCLSETYPLEKSDWYGNGTIQVTKPGNYTFQLFVYGQSSSFQYNFTIKEYCKTPDESARTPTTAPINAPNSISTVAPVSGKPTTMPVQTKAPTKQPTPKPSSKPTDKGSVEPGHYTSSIAISIYQSLKGDGLSWNELYEFSNSYYVVPCLRRNATLTIQAYPEIHPLYGEPSAVTFIVYPPVGNAKNYTRTELNKPYMLYGDYYSTTYRKWYGRKWYRNGDYTITVRINYKNNTIHFVDTKTIHIKKNNVFCSLLNSDTNIVYP